MAIFQKGILGGFSGIVGTVVGATWRGLDIMRSRPKKSSRPATEDQLDQRAKFSLIARFLRTFRPVVRNYFGQPQGEKSRSNLATAYHMSEAITGTYPDYEVDYVKVIVAKGELLGLEALAVVPQANAELLVTWSDNSGQGEAKTTDMMFLVVYNEDVKDSRYNTAATARTNGTFTYALPDSWSGNKVHCWVAVASEDGKKYGNSEYFGPLTVL